MCRTYVPDVWTYASDVCVGRMDVYVGRMDVCAGRMDVCVGLILFYELLKKIESFFSPILTHLPTPTPLMAPGNEFLRDSVKHLF